MTTIKFNPRVMTRDKRNPNVIYDASRILSDSVALSSGYVIIGVKGKPSKEAIRQTVRHELAHLGQGKPRSKHERSMGELKTYAREKRQCTPEQWNRVLPTRIKDFMPFVSWETKIEQRETRVAANKILSPKAGGGNLDAIKKARQRLAKWWV